MIHFYIKVPQEFVSVIFLDRCCVVHIPFVGMVKLKFLAQFSMDHLTVSCIFPRNLHLLFCCVSSIFSLI